MTTKKCPKCNRVLSIAEFNRAKSRADGVQSRCRSCQNSGDRSYYLRNKGGASKRRDAYRASLRAWFLAVRSGHKCRQCGETDAVCLDFHHPDKNKTDNVATLVANCCSKAVILSEMAKCIVLCANCHRRVHADIEQKKKETKHDDE